MVKTDESNGPGADEEANFIDAVKRIREELGWSQGELAKRMSDSGWDGFHQTTISRIEKGERPVRLGEARGLAKVLGAWTGQMILPPEEGKTLRDLELAVMNTEQTLRNIRSSASELIAHQFILKIELDKAQGLSLGPSADDWVTERYTNVLEAAKRALSKTPSDCIAEAEEDYYGIDQETP